MPPKIAPHYLVIGCRIPKDYFWVIDWGESNVGIETGSYDEALTMAGIENFNVMLYTSVLPPEAVELPAPPDIHHGSVLEGIIAVQHTDRPGARVTAGLLLAKVYRNSGSYLGGFACEYSGNGTVEEAEVNLHEAMAGLFTRRHYSQALYRLEFGKSVVRTFTPQKSFGTMLVGIGFSSYLLPVLKTDVEFTPSHKDKSHVKYSTR